MSLSSSIRKKHLVYKKKSTSTRTATPISMRMDVPVPTRPNYSLIQADDSMETLIISPIPITLLRTNPTM